MVVKNKIGEEKAKAKKVAKPVKDQADVAPKPKDKRKLVVQTSNYEKTHLPQPIKKAMTLKTKTAVVPSVYLIFLSQLRW